MILRIIILMVLFAITNINAQTETRVAIITKTDSLIIFDKFSGMLGGTRFSRFYTTIYLSKNLDFNIDKQGHCENEASLYLRNIKMLEILEDEFILKPYQYELNNRILNPSYVYLKIKITSLTDEESIWFWRLIGDFSSTDFAKNTSIWGINYEKGIEINTRIYLSRVKKIIFDLNAIEQVISKYSSVNSRGKGLIADVSESIRKWVNSSHNVGVIIGINNYMDKKVKILNFAVNDAKEIKKILEQKSNYSVYHELYDKEATKANILEIIDNLSKQKDIDRIIFYFAGHGQTITSGAGTEDLGFFLPVDCDSDKLFKTAISMSQVQTWAKSFKARHVLFIFDACFSGIAGGSERTKRDYNLDFLARNIGRHVLTAGTKSDRAQEFNDLGHGVLTYFLLKALNGDADIQPKDNIVTLSELEAYLKDKVTNFTKGKQHPQIIKFFDGDCELFIEINERE
jgi:hypothetical protein